MRLEKVDIYLVSFEAQVPQALSRLSTEFLATTMPTEKILTKKYDAIKFQILIDFSDFYFCRFRDSQLDVKRRKQSNYV